MKFRITIGANGTPWGEQIILATGKASNALEFIKKYVDAHPDTAEQIINNGWVDAGNGSIPIAIANLKLASS